MSHYTIVLSLKRCDCVITEFVNLTTQTEELCMLSHYTTATPKEVCH